MKNLVHVSALAADPRARSRWAVTKVRAAPRVRSAACAHAPRVAGGWRGRCSGSRARRHDRAPCGHVRAPHPVSRCVWARHMLACALLRQLGARGPVPEHVRADECGAPPPARAPPASIRRVSRVRAACHVRRRSRASRSWTAASHARRHVTAACAAARVAMETRVCVCVVFDSRCTWWTSRRRSHRSRWWAARAVGPWRLACSSPALAAVHGPPCDAGADV